MTKENPRQHLRSLKKKVLLSHEFLIPDDHYLNMTDPSSFSFMGVVSHWVVVGV